MSKTVGSSLASHMSGEVTTLATMFKLTRRDGTILTMTTHDRPLDYPVGSPSYTYSPLNSFDASSVETSSGMNVDNLDALILLDSDLLTQSDLKAGLYRYARIEIFIVNWADLTMGDVILRVGTIGETTLNRSSGTFNAELRGRMQPLQETIGRVYGALCDARLGDSRCTFDLASRTQSGIVTASASRKAFSVNGISEDVFNGGLVTWTSGLNDGLTMEVKLWSGSPSDSVELFDSMPFNIVAGDTFTMSPGCDRNLSTCRDTYNNVANFRGFPFIPGRDAVLRYPNAVG